MNYSKVIANCSEKEASDLAALILQHYSSGQVKFLSEPKQGLVMLRMRETVADSQFNAGEILVTEVRLELDGQFGFGMISGDSVKRAVAMALVDAALRKGSTAAEQLTHELNRLAEQINAERQKLHNIVATTKVAFDNM